MQDRREEFWSRFGRRAFPASRMSSRSPSPTRRSRPRCWPRSTTSSVSSRTSPPGRCGGRTSSVRPDRALPAERPEVCFFSAWDFHLPPEGPWQVIEFNDNGSGLMYSDSSTNPSTTCWSRPGRRHLKRRQRPPNSDGASSRWFAGKQKRFSAPCPRVCFSSSTKPEALERGKFGAEMEMLRELFREEGWPSEVGSTADLRWDGERLWHDGEPVSFIVNRSTDFSWRRRPRGRCATPS